MKMTMIICDDMNDRVRVEDAEIFIDSDKDGEDLLLMIKKCFGDT